MQLTCSTTGERKIFYFRYRTFVGQCKTLLFSRSDILFLPYNKNSTLSERNAMILILEYAESCWLMI